MPRYNVSKHGRSSNPFYALVLLAGLAFVISACAYGTMLVRISRHRPQEGPTATPAWIQWMQHHGTWLLLGELALLGILTVAAIGTDDYWEKRGTGEPCGTSPSNSEHHSP